MSNYISVIGCANIDFAGISNSAIKLHDSNIGTVSLSLGGVGRNIAENIARIGEQTYFFSTLGADSYLDLIVTNSANVGIDITKCAISDELPNACYLAISDANGEMLVALNDMRISERTNSEYLGEHLTFLNESAAVVIDANLTPATINYIFDKISAPIFADGVSTEKVLRLKPGLDKIHSLKVNLFEAAALVDLPPKLDNLEEIAKQLHNSGARNLYISLGKKGLYYSNCQTQNQIPSAAVRTQIENTTGCGDSMNAAIIYAYLHNLSIDEAARLSMNAAKITAYSKSTVSKEFNIENLKKKNKRGRK